MKAITGVKRPLGLIRRLVCLVWNYGADAWRYARHAQMFRYGNKCVHMQYHITAMAHVLEKGMSLADTRPGFGHVVRQELLRNIERYAAFGYPVDHVSYRMGCAVLHAYVHFHRALDFDLGGFAADVARIQACFPDGGGCEELQASTIQALAKKDFAKVARSRYSIRHFSGQPVDPKLIRDAIDIARKTPSVCNRQSWTMYWIRNPELKGKVAELQGGSRGFGESVDTMLIVATDLRSFFAINERNQAYVDGGLFSMSLMYALHYQGLGACPLNWSADVRKDRRLKKMADIPDWMNIIMLIGVGHLPDSLRVARSARKDLETFVHMRPE